MKISIVTISYNQGRFLKECIDSVLLQRPSLAAIGVALEYIVVDPGSVDGSRKLIESYGYDLVTIFESDSGPADGLNRGFAKATGDIFAYMNADDKYLPGALVTAMKVFHSNRCDVFFAHGWVISEDGSKLHRCLSHKFSLREYARGNCVVMQQSTFFRKDAYIKAGGFNEDNRVSWDGELMVDMAIAGCSIVRVNKFLSCFRVYETSISGSGNYLAAAQLERARISTKICASKGAFRMGLVLSRLVHRAIDPWYLIIRVIDGLRYGKRRIPS